jgi:hypothetical protein
VVGAGWVVVAAGSVVVGAAPVVVLAPGTVVTVDATVDVVLVATGSTSPPPRASKIGIAARSSTARAAPAKTRAGRGFESSRWVTDTSSG